MFDRNSDSKYLIKMSKAKTSSKASKLVQECLATLDVVNENFSGCSNIEEEWKVIKRAYFAKILVAHPDKGGDAAEFRDIQTSFESIRQLYDAKKVSSFATSGMSSDLVSAFSQSTFCSLFLIRCLSIDSFLQISSSFLY